MYISIIARRISRCSVGSTLLMAFMFPVVFLSVATCQSVTALYNFGSQNGSAAPQDVALAQGRDGELYGTSEGNGTTSYGSIFEVSTSRIFTELFDFNSSNISQDGCCTGQGMTLASDGSFYGAAPSGSGNSQNGVFFKINPLGAYTAIHVFTGGTDGSLPFAPPTQGSDGNLYGIAFNPGGNGSTVYQYSLSGNFNTIYEFAGLYSIAPFIQGTDGFLYGTTTNHYYLLDKSSI